MDSKHLCQRILYIASNHPMCNEPIEDKVRTSATVGQRVDACQLIKNHQGAREAIEHSTSPIMSDFFGLPTYSASPSSNSNQTASSTVADTSAQADHGVNLNSMKPQANRGQKRKAQVLEANKPTTKQGKPRAKKTREESVPPPPVTNDGKSYVQTDTVCSLVVRHDTLFQYKLHGQCDALVSSKVYPRKATGPCNLCSRKFETIPIMIPKAFDYLSGVYTLFGNFCSFGCAMTHIIEDGGFHCWLEVMNLYKLAEEVFGITDRIDPSPPSILFKHRGGHIDPETTRANATATYMLIEPPFVSHMMMVAAWQHTEDNLVHTEDPLSLKETEARYWSLNKNRPPSGTQMNEKPSVAKEPLFLRFVEDTNQKKSL